MRYVISRCEAEERDETYRFYVSEALRIVGHLDKSYRDLLDQSKVPKRSPDDIINGVKEKLRKLSG